MKHSHPTAARWIVRTTLSAAALALVVSPFSGLAVASADYKESDFASCLEREMPTDYCCEHAGGVMRNGACINPDDLRVPSGNVAGVLQEDQPPVPPTKVPTGSVTGVFAQDVQPAPPKQFPTYVLADMPTMTLATAP